MQESLHVAAAAATHEADYAFAAFAAAHGASVRASASSSSAAMADASLHVPPAHARDPYFSYGVDAEKMQRKLEKRKAGAGMTSKRK
jgi:hypothetical protein